MDSLTLHLIDFTALVQLSAGFYIAFIAIEYTKSFSSVVSRHLLNFEGNIIHKLAELSIEKKVLEEFANHNHYKEGAGKRALEQTSLDIDSLNTNINDKKDKINQYIKKVCRFDMFRYLSIYMFIYCLVVLFVSGLRKDEQIWLNFQAWFTVLSYGISLFCFIISIWLHDTNKYDRWLINGTLILTVLIFIASIYCKNIHPILSSNDGINWWDTIVIVTVLLPYLVFCLYILLTAFSYKQINSKLKGFLSELETQRNPIKTDIQNMEGQVRQEEREKRITLTDEEAPDGIESM